MILVNPYMTLKISIVLTALALSCLPQLANAQGNLVVNGLLNLVQLV